MVYLCEPGQDLILDQTGSIRFNQRKVKTKFGLRAFSNYGLDVWNILHDNIKNAKYLSVFKRKLKTLLLQQEYDCG